MVILACAISLSMGALAFLGTQTSTTYCSVVKGIATATDQTGCNPDNPGGSPGSSPGGSPGSSPSVPPAPSSAAYPLTGSFYADNCGGNYPAEGFTSGSFCVKPTDKPVFTQTFSSIDFNSPTALIPGAPTSPVATEDPATGLGVVGSGVGVWSRPFTDISTNADGNYVGSVIAGDPGAGAVLPGTMTF
jgi:hypothetical protein